MRELFFAIRAHNALSESSGKDNHNQKCILSSFKRKKNEHLF